MHIEKLKTLRIVHRLTGNEVAKAIGISASTYRNYERGSREPCLETVIKIAKFYNVTVDYLLGVDRKAPESTVKILSQRYNLSELEIEILMFYISMPQRERLQFLKGIDSVKLNAGAYFEGHLLEALAAEEREHSE